MQVIHSHFPSCKGVEFVCWVASTLHGVNFALVSQLCPVIFQINFIRSGMLSVHRYVLFVFLFVCVLKVCQCILL